MRGIYRHFFEAAVDLAFFRRLVRPERFPEHFVLDGDWADLQAAVAERGAVVATGHLGNWELTRAVFRHLGVPVSAVARTGGGWLARRLERFRRQFGQETIPKDNALPAAVRALREKRAVLFLIDQSAGAEGIPAPFFGRTVPTFVSPAALALKLDVPLYAGGSERLGPGIRYRCRLARVPAEGNAEALTRRLNAILEAYVRARPEQWWWFHRRFKPAHYDILGVPWSPAGVPLTELVPPGPARPLLDGLRDLGPHLNALVVEADGRLEDPASRPAQVRYLRKRLDEARASVRALREAAAGAHDDHGRAVADRMDVHLDGFGAGLDAGAIAACRAAAVEAWRRHVRLGHALLLDEAHAAGAHDVFRTTLASLRRHYRKSGCRAGARACRRLARNAFAERRRDLDAFG